MVDPRGIAVIYDCLLSVAGQLLLEVQLTPDIVHEPDHISVPIC